MTRDELLMKLYDEQTAQARHHESLRVNFVSIVLTLGTLLLAVIGWDKRITDGDIPTIVLLFILGVVGVVASLKHYERNRMHARRARVMREMAEATLGETDIGPALRHARIEAEKKNKFLSRHVRLKHVWTIPPMLLALASVLLFVIACFLDYVVCLTSAPM